MNPQFQVLVRFFPTNLEDRASLAKMKSLERYDLHQLDEIELGQPEAQIAVGLFVTIPLMVVGLFEGFGPDLQDVALAALVVKIGCLGIVHAPASRLRTWNQ